MARVALVTGGMGGLGEAVCFKLSALGYCVVTTYSPGNPKVEQWLAMTRDMGFNFRAYACDVADYDSAQACVSKIEAELGPVDVLVNNAGITRDMTFKKMDKPNWDAVMATNLDSVFNMTKPVCDGMVERGWGRIINISSVNGQKGAFGQTNYSAAKAGMHGFTKALALEVARKGVTVNTRLRLDRPDQSRRQHLRRHPGPARRRRRERAAVVQGRPATAVRRRLPSGHAARQKTAAQRRPVALRRRGRAGAPLQRQLSRRAVRTHELGLGAPPGQDHAGAGHPTIRGRIHRRARRRHRHAGTARHGRTADRAGQPDARASRPAR